MRPIASGASLAAATNVVSSPGLSQIFVIASKSGRRVLVCISVHPRTSWQAAETAASWKATSIGTTGIGALAIQAYRKRSSKRSLVNTATRRQEAGRYGKVGDRRLRSWRKEEYKRK